MRFHSLESMAIEREVKKQNTSSSWISKLSEDLLLEIFLRSSFKSIGRCKGVSKLWLKILTNPHFPKLHHNHSSSSSRNSDLIFIALYRKHEFYSASCDSFDEILALPTPKESLFYKRGPYVIGSCNGLICLSDIGTTYIDTCMYIWNPVINECVQIHWPPSMIKPKSSDIGRDVVLGFGYSHDFDEYKVLRMVFVYDEDVVCDRGEVMVYTLGTMTNSWRVTEVRNDLPIYNNSRAADVNGVLHWVPHIELGSIVSFHVGNEKFGEVSWPEFDDQPNSSDLHLGVLHGRLSVFCFSTKGVETVDAWVMNEYGVNDSWTRMFSIRHIFLRHLWTRMSSIRHPTSESSIFRIYPVTVRKNGEILLLINHSDFVLYDPVRQSSRSLERFHGICDFGFEAIKYVESLTSVVALMAGSSGEKQQ